MKERCVARGSLALYIDMLSEKRHISREEALQDHKRADIMRVYSCRCARLSLYARRQRNGPHRNSPEGIRGFQEELWSERPRGSLS